MSTFPTALDTFKNVSSNPYMDDGAALATEVVTELQAAIAALQQVVGTTDYAQTGSLMARLIENLGSPYNILMRNSDGDVEGISTVAFNPVTFALEALILAASAVSALSEVAPLALQVGESGTFRELILSPGAAAPKYNDGAAARPMIHGGNFAGLAIAMKTVRF
jgi:hypothetical protein